MACDTLGPAMRAASNRDRFNEMAQSNQQDAIGEMETNGQQKTARDPGGLVQADCQPRKVRIGQYREGCVALRTGRTADQATRRDEGAVAASALPGPVMRMIAATLRALRLKCCVAVSCQAGMRVLEPVCVTRAAAHHQVGHQQRDDQGAGQPGHEALPCLPGIRYRRPSFANFWPNKPPSHPGTIIHSLEVLPETMRSS